MSTSKSWKDISGYSRDDTERTPVSYQLEGCKLRITITRHIHIPKTSWLLECDGFFRVELKGNKSAEEAQATCLRLSKDALKAALKELES